MRAEKGTPIEKKETWKIKVIVGFHEIRLRLVVYEVSLIHLVVLSLLPFWVQHSDPVIWLPLFLALYILLWVSPFGPLSITGENQRYLFGYKQITNHLTYRCVILPKQWSRQCSLWPRHKSYCCHQRSWAPSSRPQTGTPAPLTQKPGFVWQTA